MSEKNTQTQIENWINMIGGVAIRTQSGKIRQNYDTRSGDTRTRFIHLAQKGTADIIACINSTPIAIEVKKNPKEVEKWLKYPNRINGKLYAYDPRIESQKQFMDRWTDSGGIHLLVSSLEEVEQDIKNLKII